MGADTEAVRRHVKALLEEAEAKKLPSDVVGRLLIQEAVEIWSRNRSWEDIASELTSVADNLDPDADHEFMRP